MGASLSCLSQSVQKPCILQEIKIAECLRTAVFKKQQHLSLTQKISSYQPPEERRTNNAIAFSLLTKRISLSDCQA